MDQSIQFKWISRMVLGEITSPLRGVSLPMVGLTSMVLGRPTWKWWSKGHSRCLVEAIKRVDPESKEHTQKRASDGINISISSLS
jgi:hypothetical protein